MPNTNGSPKRILEKIIIKNLMNTGKTYRVLNKLGFLACISITTLLLASCGEKESFDDCDARVLAFDGVRALIGLESPTLQESVKRGWTGDAGKRCEELYSASENRATCKDKTMQLFKDAESKGITTGTREKYESYEAEVAKQCSDKLAAFDQQMKK